MTDITFEQIQRDIEQLEPDDVERLRDWLNARTSHTNSSAWGEKLVTLVNEFPLEETDQFPTDDPESWVREYRRTQTNRRIAPWGDQ